MTPRSLWIAAVLALALLVAACGSGEDSQDQSETTAAPTTTTMAPTTVAPTTSQ